MKNKPKIFIFLFFLFLIAGFFSFVEANENKILITEIMYNPPGTDTKHEWLEIFNASSENIDLNGWKFFEASTNHGLVLYQGSYILDSDTYAIIADDAATFHSDHPDYKNTIIDSVFSLSNSGETIAIKNNLGEVISDLSYSSDWGSDIEGTSLEKIDILESNVKENWQESYILGGTPGYENFTLDDKETEYSDQIRINELLPNPSGDDKSNEFIELYNFNTEQIDLENWQLKDKSGETYTFPKKIIGIKEYLAIYSVDTKISLNNSGEEDVSLINPNGEVIAYINYTGTNQENYSYSFKDDDVWQWTSQPTPGAENKFDKTGPETPDPVLTNPDASVCNGQVCLNEILPNPKGDEGSGEYIEIFNSEDTNVDIGGWILKDKSSTKYTFSADAKIPAKNYLLIYRTDFKFSMNNSGPEIISLFDENGKTVSSVLYNGAKENVSYNFDGAFWHWSRFLTPGKENKFNRAPKIKISKTKEAFVGVPIVFSASAKDKDKDKLKYSWDFGDGHKSYMQKPTHTYLKKKTYHVILTVDDGSEKFAKITSIKVKDYPKTNVKITEILPNPPGNDTGQEKISLLNNSKKKVNLKGWKISTGNKKMINHPIAKDFLIAPGKIATLTRKNASFYLTNTAMKLELRYPNGKTADKVAYAKDKIEDGEIYKKTNNQWAWVTPVAENKLVIAEKQTKNINALAKSDTEIQNVLGKYSASPDWQKKKENRIVLLNYSLPQMPLHSFDNRLSTALNENYLYKDKCSCNLSYLNRKLQKHYAVVFLQNISSSLNSYFNSLYKNS